MGAVRHPRDFLLTQREIGDRQYKGNPSEYEIDLADQQRAACIPAGSHTNELIDTKRDIGTVNHQINTASSNQACLVSSAQSCGTMLTAG